MKTQNIQQYFDMIGNACYSSKETQEHSFSMGEYITKNNIEGDIIECGIAAGGNFASMLFWWSKKGMGL